MGLLRQLFAAIRLRLNEAKGAVDLASHRKILGYSFWVGAGRMVRLRVARKALDAMKDRVRHITRRTGGRGGQHAKLVEARRHGPALRTAHIALRRAGRPKAPRMTSTSRTARCGPACRVVWQGRPG